jgi:hypothetical protein
LFGPFAVDVLFGVLLLLVELLLLLCGGVDIEMTGLPVMSVVSCFCCGSSFTHHFDDQIYKIQQSNPRSLLRAKDGTHIRIVLISIVLNSLSLDLFVFNVMNVDVAILICRRESQKLLNSVTIMPNSPEKRRLSEAEAQIDPK